MNAGVCYIRLAKIRIALDNAFTDAPNAATKNRFNHIRKKLAELTAIVYNIGVADLNDENDLGGSDT